MNKNQNFSTVISTQLQSFLTDEKLEETEVIEALREMVEIEFPSQDQFDGNNFERWKDFIDFANGTHKWYTTCPIEAPNTNQIKLVIADVDEDGLHLEIFISLINELCDQRTNLKKRVEKDSRSQLPRVLFFAEKNLKESSRKARNVLNVFTHREEGRRWIA